jgi:hypothetical protein
MKLEDAIEHAEQRAGHGITDCQREHERLAGWLRELTELREAVAPFAEIVNTTSGRIPTERLSLANWHALVKAFNKRPNVKVTGSPALSASPRGLPGYATED